MRCAAAITLVLALAGCGADGRSDAVQRADSICAEVRDQVESLGQPKSLPRLRHVASRTRAVSARGLLRLGGVDDEGVRATAALMAGHTALLDQLVRAAAVRDLEGIRRIAARGRALDKRVRERARAAGLRTCGATPAIPGG